MVPTRTVQIVPPRLRGVSPGLRNEQEACGGICFWEPSKSHVEMTVGRALISPDSFWSVAKKADSGRMPS